MKNIEETDELQDKLDFLGLKLQKLPKFITEATVPNFNISRINNDKDLNVYKFVPIDQIEILLTPCLRSDNIKIKYTEAFPLKAFLEERDNDIEEMLYSDFMEIVRNANIEEIEKVGKVQESFLRIRTV